MNYKITIVYTSPSWEPRVLDVDTQAGGSWILADAGATYFQVNPVRGESLFIPLAEVHEIIVEEIPL